MKKNAQEIWIQEGYRFFAYEGPHGLKVERLAKIVEKNKSSFYHYFADLEVFTSVLLEAHLKQAKIIAIKEGACNNLDELIAVIVEHKIDLLFNRQLKIHRENKEFEACFTKTNQLTVEAMLDVWQEGIGLKGEALLADLMLQLSLENFYLQITDETLNPTWLKQYFEDVKRLVKAFKASGNLQAKRELIENNRL